MRETFYNYKLKMFIICVHMKYCRDIITKEIRHEVSLFI